MFQILFPMLGLFLTGAAMYYAREAWKNQRGTPYQLKCIILCACCLALGLMSGFGPIAHHQEVLPELVAGLATPCLVVVRLVFMLRSPLIYYLLAFADSDS